MDAPRNLPEMDESGSIQMDGLSVLAFEPSRKQSKPSPHVVPHDARLVALFLLCTGLAQAAAPTVLQRPIDLDTGQGVLHGSLLLPQQATRRRWC
jgi:hypothetical protein